MQFHALNFSCCCNSHLNNAVPFKTLVSHNNPPFGTGVIFRSTWKTSLDLKQLNRGGAINSSSEEQNSGITAEATRKVVEHICLLKAKPDLSDKDEKDMLDFLYTCQYQMRGILAISLGRISYENVDGYTHAVFMRFQNKEDLSKFYEHPFYLGVLKDHVTPYCHEFGYFDYESEIQDDILSIFRKGEEFNFGVEYIFLISLKESSLGDVADDALTSLAELTMQFPSLIVQATKGSTFNPGSKDYTHAVVIRFRSSEAFDIFMGTSEYKDVWRSKFQPIIEKKLSISFSVDPVGNELM
ncbi:stress-response A/B barrel domain-containing protein UP3 [Rutidosis leptorrhynchoides]|uniref:stress-response A/B barrel domain-containing protein UP3 n=1 Tax=Rutidosis leptorrhynchoides TaxID=125765 RepID=UPI003A997094